MNKIVNSFGPHDPEAGQIGTQTQPQSTVPILEAPSLESILHDFMRGVSARLQQQEKEIYELKTSISPFTDLLNGHFHRELEKRVYSGEKTKTESFCNKAMMVDPIYASQMNLEHRKSVLNNLASNLQGRSNDTQ